MVMAFAVMRDKKRMWELLQMINPVNHSSTTEDMMQYKVEPYVMAADVYAVLEHSGRGGWTWYTGSAGWMYQLIIEYVLGLKLRSGTLEFEPCLPEEWTTVTIKYKYRTSTYVIEMRQQSTDTEKVSISL